MSVPPSETKSAAVRALDAATPGSKAGIVRTLIGGALMGIANIIPGVSGGTMVLALGLYEKFVESVADVTRLRFRLPSLLFLGLLVIAAVVAIGLMAGPIVAGLENAHHLMYGLFIGLTLGGVPLLWKEMEPVNAVSIGGTVAGLLVMIVIAFALKEIQLPQTWIVFMLAGVIASAAMVLPGISGSYLLLIFGLYLPISKAIKDFVYALKDLDFGTCWTLGVTVHVPLGIGVLLGIAGLTNALKALLHRWHGATVGVLLGLLLGSVIGIYPFQELREKGELIAAAHPVTPLNVLLVIVAVAVGFALTIGVSRLGKEPAGEAPAA
ncbi:MAG: putative rane protein [Candidatus Sumerlaeota bacterium]|nr:putative rane protein [Candidatus Sumerlaeota bacterium]